MTRHTTETLDVFDADGTRQYRVRWTRGSEHCGVAPAGRLEDYRVLGSLDAAIMVCDDVARGCTTRLVTKA